MIIKSLIENLEANKVGKESTSLNTGYRLSFPTNSGTGELKPQKPKRRMTYSSDPSG
uniref:Putative calcium-binding protein CML49 n=1 Tax=Rhizophora mucronata TaxID=61149 RepID=A0A2P2KYL3_RHIMU